MMLLHSLLTITRKDLLQVLNLKSSEAELNDDPLDITEEIIQMRKDLDYRLIDNSLGLN